MALSKETKENILSATRDTMFGVILRCAMNVGRDEQPRFVGKAMVTSDGFVMCDFVDSNGQMRMGAFVGHKRDVFDNVTGLGLHLGLTEDEKADLRVLADAWMGLEIVAVR